VTVLLTPLDFYVGQYILNEYSQSDIMNVLPQLERTLGTTVRYLFNLFIIPLLSFFILKDGRMIRDGFLDMFDDRKQAESALRDAHVLLLDYMRAVLFLCFTTLVSFTIALTLLRVRYAILLAFAAFVLEFVPLVGPLTAGVLILGVSMFNRYQYSLLWIVLFLVVYRLLQDYVLSPHLMRKGVKLHPLLLLFGIFAGGEIGGIVGIFLSVPVLALLRLVFYEWRKRSAVSGEPVGAG
jgi:predicted PurR-regulated permease PerM